MSRFGSARERVWLSPRRQGYGVPPRIHYCDCVGPADPQQAALAASFGRRFQPAPVRKGRLLAAIASVLRRWLRR